MVVHVAVNFYRAWILIYKVWFCLFVCYSTTLFLLSTLICYCNCFMILLRLKKKNEDVGQ